MEKRPEISHLTEDQLDELYRRYIAGERNADLISEYKISIAPNSLIKVLPPIQLESVFCPHCNVQMYEWRKSKGNLTKGNTNSFCKHCDHKHFLTQPRGRQQHCTCKACVSRRAQDKVKKEQALREKIRTYWLPRIGDAVQYESLDTEEKIYLLSLINAQANLDHSIVKSIAERSRDAGLAPSESQETEILQLLYRRRVIVVDPESPLSAFSSDKVESASVVDVRWIINVKLGNEHRSSIETIQRQITKELALASVGSDAHKVKTMAIDVLTEQAMRQLHYQCDRLSIPFAAEKKGREVVASLLLSHSLSEVCYFGYLAARRASDYYLNSNVSKTQASNIIPSKMQHYGIKAKSEAWEIKSKYFTNDPRSELSKVLFDLVLKTEDNGLYKKVGAYFSPTTYIGDPAIVSLFSCPSCGSKAVHVSAREQKIIIDCKDCIARSPMIFTQTTRQN